MSFPYDMTGTLLDRRYQITRMIGKGGMGHVYEATHIALEQTVAIKVLHPRFAYEHRFRDRFIREARSASKIRHRNVVRITDFGETPDGSVYFVMEFLDGHDMGQELEHSGVMPWPRTRHILLQAVGALRAAHAKDIIHRDIKPGNCFLTTDKEDGLVDFVKLLDFGIAKVGRDTQEDEQGKGLTGTGEVFGTATYMSPEQARGDDLDARSDMYSLGVMAYRMLTGEVPFTGVNSIHIITRHLRDRPKPLRSLVPTIPVEVEQCVLKTLAKEPDDRYDSMGTLEQALQSIPESAGQPRTRRTRVWTGASKSATTMGSTSGTLDVEPLSNTSAATTADEVTVVSPATSEKNRHAVNKRSFTRPAAPPLLPRSSSSAPPVGISGGDRPSVGASAPANHQNPRLDPQWRDAGRGPTPRPPGTDGTPRPSSSASATNPPPGASNPLDRSPWSSSSGAYGSYESQGHTMVSAAAWASNSMSTGPLTRAGDSSAETNPQVEPIARPTTLSSRAIFTVLLLIVLVVGSSVLGTLMFLSNEAGAIEAPPAMNDSVMDIASESPPRANDGPTRAGAGLP